MVLLDLQLGDANGFEVLAELRETYPALPVVVVYVFLQRHFIRGMLAGAVKE